MTTPKKILIAEDEQAIGKTLKRKLESEGFEVVHVLDGQAALEAIEKDTYDMLLLDLVMPKLDGFGVLEALKKKKSNQKVIAATNLGQASDIDRAKELGAIDYLVKSDTPLADIVAKVKKYLD